jgi:hypothetical protein
MDVYGLDFLQAPTAYAALKAHDKAYYRLDRTKRMM